MTKGRSSYGAIFGGRTAPALYLNRIIRCTVLRIFRNIPAIVRIFTISLTVIILGISSLLKSQIISVLLNLAIFGAPAILSMIDFKILDNFSMVSILSANKLFFNNLQLILSLLGIIILTVLGAVLLKKSQKTC